MDNIVSNKLNISVPTDVQANKMIRLITYLLMKSVKIHRVDTIVKSY